MWQSTGMKYSTGAKLASSFTAALTTLKSTVSRIVHRPWQRSTDPTDLPAACVVSIVAVADASRHLHQHLTVTLVSGLPSFGFIILLYRVVMGVLFCTLAKKRTSLYQAEREEHTASSRTAYAELFCVFLGQAYVFSCAPFPCICLANIELRRPLAPNFILVWQK